MHEQIINGHQVQTDGRTVWINGPEGACRARFCPVSGEVDVGDCGEPRMFMAGDWISWVSEVRHRLGFLVPDSFKPAYVAAAPNADTFDVAVPIPMILFCPSCKQQHLDVGYWATARHRTHLCEQTPAGKTGCGQEFRPAHISTVGVKELP